MFATKEDNIDSEASITIGDWIEGDDMSEKVNEFKFTIDEDIDKRLTDIEESVEEMKDDFEGMLKSLYDLNNKINTLAHMAGSKFMYEEMGNPDSLNVIKIESKEKGWKTTS
jgi:hypothetical protein